VNSTPTPTDQPDLRHYIDALRRSWKVPALAAVGLGLLLALVPPSTAVQATARVALVDESGIATAMGLPKELGNRYTTVGSLVALVQSDDFKSAVTKTLGFKPKVGITGEEASATVTVRATNANGDRAQAIVDAYVNEALARRRELRSETIVGALAALQEQRSSIDKRLEQLDQTLTKIDDPRSALAAGLLAEREKVLTDRTDLGVAEAGFHQLKQLSGGGVTRIESSRAIVNRSGSRPKKALIGVFFGGLLGFAAVLGMAFFDRRLRNRADVERVAGTGFLIGIMSDDADHGDDALALAAALSAVGRSHPSESIRLVPVRGESETSGLLERLHHTVARQNGDSHGGLSLSSVSVASSAAQASADPGGRAVIVARAGRTREEDVALALDQLRNGGVDVVGLVLTGVPRRRLAAAVL
jgi:hypothetical protein